MNATRDSVNDVFITVQNKLKDLLNGKSEEVVGLTLDQALFAYNNIIKSMGDVDRSLTSLASEKVKAMKEHYARMRQEKDDDAFDVNNLDLSDLN